MSNIKEYETIFAEFIAGHISASEFQSRYLKKFKDEQEFFSESIYAVLEDVFGAVDSFTLNAELLAQNPRFYLNEVQLKENVRLAADRLRALDNQSYS